MRFVSSELRVLVKHGTSQTHARNPPMTDTHDGNGVVLHMREPIWVWLYDYGPATHPEGWKDDTSGVKAYPQAHTYAFRTEKDALEHPAKMGWKHDHPYVLQKTYLTGVPLSSSEVEPVAWRYEHQFGFNGRWHTYFSETPIPEPNLYRNITPLVLSSALTEAIARAEAAEENLKATRGLLEYVEDSNAKLERKWLFQLERAEAAEKECDEAHGWQSRAEAAEKMVEHLRTSRDALHVECSGLKADLRTAHDDAIRKAAARAVQVGDFGDLSRDKLTDTFGKPRYDMMKDIERGILALLSDASKTGRDND